MCGEYYEANPAGKLSLKELLASVRAVSPDVTSQDEKIVRVLYECTLVPENYIPPRELLAEARRIRDTYPDLIIN